MKNPTKKIHAAATQTPANDTDTAFFADQSNPSREAREQALEVITRLLIWFAEGTGIEQRGLRATIALYCVRPDLINGATLEQIGADAGVTRQAAHKLAKDFRLSMGYVS